MVVLTRVIEAELTSAVRVGIGGAEANVAVHLAEQGIDVGWASRLGSDPFGELIRTELLLNRVDLSRVEIDPSASTGVYVKTRDPHLHSTVKYFRAGSAASKLAPSDVRNLRLQEFDLIHVSGIVPALSQSASDFIDALIDECQRLRVRVSFDVNFRPALWPAVRAAERLKQLAQRADLVFVGRDEAEALWGTTTADQAIDLLDRPFIVVVKDGDIEAVEADRRGIDECITRVPTPAVKVVELVGAGDAFAGGYLAGLLQREGATDRLERGHLSAAWTIGGVEDVKRGHRPLPFKPVVDSSPFNRSFAR